MDLDFLNPRTVGRARRELDYEIVGELTKADISLLSEERGIVPIDPIQLRDSHHALARCLARGDRPAQAAIVTGYSPSRISILQRAPAFQELIEFYRQTLEVHVDYRTRFRDMGVDVLTALWVDSTENPGKYSPNFLLELGKTLADRGGLVPESRSVNTQVNIDIAARLEKGLARADKVKVIEHENN